MVNTFGLIRFIKWQMLLHASFILLSFHGDKRAIEIIGCKYKIRIIILKEDVIIENRSLKIAFQCLTLCGTLVLLNSKYFQTWQLLLSIIIKTGWTNFSGPPC